MIIIILCMYIYQIITLYIQFLFINYSSIKLKKVGLQSRSSYRGHGKHLSLCKPSPLWYLPSADVSSTTLDQQDQHLEESARCRAEEVMKNGVCQAVLHLSIFRSVADLYFSKME
jgi:hypothetical protein